MSTMKDAAINGYQKAFDDLQKEYKKFKKDNVTKTGSLNFCVMTQDPAELYIELQSVIHWTVIISNTVIHDIISETDNEFMDAFRHIDNIIKHEQDSNINITDLISSTPKVKGDLLKLTKQPVFYASMELVSLWEDLSATIPCKRRFQHQRDAYNTYLKDELVMKTMDKLNNVLKIYI